MISLRSWDWVNQVQGFGALGVELWKGSGTIREINRCPALFQPHRENTGQKKSLNPGTCKPYAPKAFSSSACWLLNLLNPTACVLSPKTTNPSPAQESVGLMQLKRAPKRLGLLGGKRTSMETIVISGFRWRATSVCKVRSCKTDRQICYEEYHGKA